MLAVLAFAAMRFGVKTTALWAVWIVLLPWSLLWRTWPTEPRTPRRARGRHRSLLLGALLALLAGCSTGSVWLKDPRTGQTEECGPYFTSTHAWTTAGYQKLRDCVQDYQRQGWERTPEPVKK